MKAEPLIFFLGALNGATSVGFWWLSARGHSRWVLLGWLIVLLTITTVSAVLVDRSPLFEHSCQEKK